MTGVDIVGLLLRADALLTAVVPAASIKAGILPDNTPLPALLVRSVSKVERQKLKREGLVRFTERVAVTVRVGAYRGQADIMKMVLSACAGWTGDMAPARDISVLNAGTGPDVIGPANTFEQTQDFRVSFDAPA